MEINPLVLHTRLRKIARPLQNLSERRVATTVWQIVLKIITYTYTYTHFIDAP